MKVHLECSVVKKILLFCVALLVVQFVKLYPSDSSGDNFITAKLSGRLGNQLFEIASAMSVGIDNNAKVYFFDGKNSTVPTEIDSNIKYVFPFINYVNTPKKCAPEYKALVKTYGYRPIKYKRGMCLASNFWSEKYFKHNSDKIIPCFLPSEEIINDLFSRYSEILDHPCSVAIHIRTLLGEKSKWRKLRPLYGQKYLKEALKFFPSDALFVVFSDNIEWCKAHLSNFDVNMIFVEGDTYYNDFYLMSFCKHNIVSNSTFSWWSAYLNQNPDKITVAPRYFHYPHVRHQKMTEDVWPEKWITIDKCWEN